MKKIPGFGPMALDRIRSRVAQERIREIERASWRSALISLIVICAAVAAL